jgi:FdhD protein
VLHVDASGAVWQDDRIVVEEPLTIRACGPREEPVELTTTLRTPGADADLAVGWLIAEGLAGPGDVVAIRAGDALEVRDPDDVITVDLAHPLDPARVAHRHGASTASCGLCGRVMIRALVDRIPPLDADGSERPPIDWDVLAGLPARLRAHQDTFGVTGGLHATGVFTCTGELVVLREDVGRHNALDAAIGALARGGPWPPAGLVALLSGRIGVELVAKAAAAGVAILAGVGAPTDLAVRTADVLGVTLVGFLRQASGNVHTHPSRIRHGDDAATRRD